MKNKTELLAGLEAELRKIEKVLKSDNEGDPAVVLMASVDNDGSRDILGAIMGNSSNIDDMMLKTFQKSTPILVSAARAIVQIMKKKGVSVSLPSDFPSFPDPSLN